MGYVFFNSVAEDICVGLSALDALRLGYKMTMIENATRGEDSDSQVRCRLCPVRHAVGVIILDPGTRLMFVMMVRYCV